MSLDKITKLNFVPPGSGPRLKVYDYWYNLMVDTVNTLSTSAAFGTLTTGITAFSTGGQASATALASYYNNVTVCAASGDSVKLPTAVAASCVIVKNNGAAPLAVFPYTGDAIDGLGANNSITLPTGSTATFRAIGVDNWESDIESMSLNIDMNPVGIGGYGIYGTIDVTTTGLTADALYGVYFDINGLATDNNTSTLNGYAVQLTSTSTSRADNIGFIVGIDGTRDTADTDNGVIVGFVNYTLNHASALAYGLRVSGISGTGAHTDGTFYGVHVECTAVVASGLAVGLNVVLDATTTGNAYYGLKLSKDVQRSSATGNISSTNSLIYAEQDNDSLTGATGALTVSNTLAYLSMVNTTVVAQSDVYGGLVLDVKYTATTSNPGTATNSATGLLIDYDIVETSGTLSNSAFNVAFIDFDGTGTPDMAAGTYNLLLIDGDTAASPAYAASVILNGIKVDVSGMTITDADLTLNGINVVLPAAGTSPMKGLYVTDGTLAVTAIDGVDALIVTGRTRSGSTIGDGLSSAYSAVKTLYYTLGINGVAGCDYNFASAANTTEQGKQMGAGAIIPAKSRILDIVCFTEVALTGGTMAFDFGITSGSNEFLAAGAVESLNAIVGVTAGASPFAAALGAAAQSVYISGVPSANWSTLSTGKWQIMITYIDASAIA